jgi:hypothetical protein
MKVSDGTFTRPVISRFAFARRSAASVTTLGVMLDAHKKSLAQPFAAQGFMSAPSQT